MKKVLKALLLVFSLTMLICVLIGCNNSKNTSSIKKYSLKVYPSVEGGTVTKLPDKERYEKGETVTLKAIPADGCDFAYWIGDGFDYLRDTEITVTITEDIILLAYFGSIYTFEEDFSSNKNNWAENETENYNIKIDNGKYLMTLYSPNWGIWVFKGFPNENFKFKAEVNFQFQSLTEYGLAGFIFNEEDKNNNYLFSISTYGNYPIYKIVDNNWYAIEEWTPADINLNISNTISVQKEGKKYSFFINGNYLAEVEVEKNLPFVALMAASDDVVPITVCYDNYSCTGLEVYPVEGNLSIQSSLYEFDELKNADILEGPALNN